MVQNDQVDHFKTRKVSFFNYLFIFVKRFWKSKKYIWWDILPVVPKMFHLDLICLRISPNLKKTQNISYLYQPLLPFVSYGCRPHITILRAKNGPLATRFTPMPFTDVPVCSFLCLLAHIDAIRANRPESTIYQGTQIMLNYFSVIMDSS